MKANNKFNWKALATGVNLCASSTALGIACSRGNSDYQPTLTQQTNNETDKQQNAGLLNHQVWLKDLDHEVHNQKNWNDFLWNENQDLKEENRKLEKQNKILLNNQLSIWIELQKVGDKSQQAAEDAETAIAIALANKEDLDKKKTVIITQG